MVFNFLRRRVQVYTAFGNDQYFQVSGKLRNAGIIFSIRTPNISRSRGRTLFGNLYDRSTQYDIYVKTEDEHRALQAIHSKL